MRQRYFVSYSHFDGFGCAVVFGPPQITELDDVVEMAQLIERDGPIRQVVILNVQPLPIVPNR